VFSWSENPIIMKRGAKNISEAFVKEKDSFLYKCFVENIFILLVCFSFEKIIFHLSPGKAIKEQTERLILHFQ
jgi:hypothetical protein